METPEWKEQEAEYLSNLKGMDLCTKFPIKEGCQYQIHEGGLKEMYLDNVWRPSLAVTGMEGLPSISTAGNVVRPSTSVRLSMRLSPSQDPQQILAIIKEKLTTDVPYNA